MDQSERRLEHCYSILSLCLAAIHNLFLIYHVEAYVYSFKINQSFFWFGEIIFLLWNSINDPLFGYLLDKNVLIGHLQSKHEIIFTKIRKIQYFGPCLAASFYLFWCPELIFGVEMNFLIGLCLYDSFMTLLDLSISSLLSDLSTDNNKRTKLSKARSVGNIIASFFVFISYYLWDKDQMDNFKFFCGVVALLSGLGFILTSRYMITCLNTLPKSDSLTDHRNHQDHESLLRKPTQSAYEKSIPTEPRSSMPKALKYLIQLCKGKNFAIFIAVSLLQVFHCHFNSNFMPLFLEVLLQNQFPDYFCPLVMGISFLLPHLNNFYFLNLCSRKGTYFVIKLLLLIKLSIACLVYMADYQMIWLIAIFIASNRIFTEGICKLCDLIISDLIDEDFIENERESTASSFVFGTAALLTKPGQTFAPLVGTFLLTKLANHNFKEVSDFATDKTVPSLDELSTLKEPYLFVLTSVPIFCASIQLLLWQKFDLRGSKLDLIKSSVEKVYNKVHLV